MKAIYLTGFMGVGKTTVGKELSRALGLPMLDLDLYIEETKKVTIAELFSTFGEKHFRKIESEALQAAPKENVIIATGGGVVIREENRKYMNENGITIFLHNPLDKLLARISGDTKRPIASNSSKDDLLEIYKGRLPYYEEAQYHISTKDKSPIQVVKEIKGKLTKS